MDQTKIQRVNIGAREGLAVPASYEISAMLLIYCSQDVMDTTICKQTQKNINKTWDLLQTTDGQNIVFIGE